ncbi:hypothetical protein WJX81_008223 [Elliptochloris bilobata]|uniref:Uncharacterized protein n=1 Tax=Elliptochloris bilobata TaxID=381761 RepID=A0AAW1QYK7_9CHLO
MEQVVSPALASVFAEAEGGAPGEGWAIGEGAVAMDGGPAAALSPNDLLNQLLGYCSGGAHVNAGAATTPQAGGSHSQLTSPASALQCTMLRSESTPVMALTSPTSKRRDSDTSSAIVVKEVTPLWLRASATEKYLLLVDNETGDVLMPLFYMKSVFEANYSRKLSTLKHRKVVVPPAVAWLEDGAGVPHWQWAFESPPHLKAIVRQELGEEIMPQGHLRLVLATIVYNAMAQKAALRALPLFHALSTAMRASTYNPLLTHPPAEPAPAAEPSPAALPLFRGPWDLAAMARKYIVRLRDPDDGEAVGAKRSRSLYAAEAAPAAAGQADGSAGFGQASAEAAAALSPGASECRAAAECRALLLRLVERYDKQLRTMDDELALVKTCILQLYTGRQLGPPTPPSHSMPAPAPTAAVHVFTSTPGGPGTATKLF